MLSIMIIILYPLSVILNYPALCLSQRLKRASTKAASYWNM